MGMFDYIVCDMPLPGTTPAWFRSGHKFQTKDTLPQYMETHTIAEDGSFSEKDFTGHVEFCWSNVSGSGPGIYTPDGADAEFATYAATIVDGRVVKLIQSHYSIEPALPNSEMAILLTAPTQEQVKAWQKREAESLIGRSLYVFWGGQKDGYPVEVIAENKKQLCVKHEDGDFELLDRPSRGRTFFDTEAEARHDRKQSTDDWAARRQKYDDYAAEWKRRRDDISGSPPAQKP